MVETDGSTVTEAILDVVSSHPGGLRKSLVDVAIGTPHTAIYQDTERIPGAAATGGEFAKRERYGTHVMPLCFEAHG
eukprot:11968980-Karenia_brevis.AAC.1